VGLYKQKDSAIAGGAITDDGNYYLAIKYIGFETYYISDI
jgi:hypothetical protein